MNDEISIPEYLSNLNDQQLKGALHFKGPILILAGAGSGKTRVLTRRIAHLIDYYKVSPRNIVAVTFTNKAAGEMKERLISLLGERGQRVTASTFHSLGLKILRRHAGKLNQHYTSDFAIYDTQDSKTILKEISKELKLDESKYPPRYLQAAIDGAKNRGETAEEFSNNSGSYNDSIIGDVYLKYQRKLLESNAMDFGDLLLNTEALFKQEKEVLLSYQDEIKFLLVDEFQDTNSIQYRLIRLLAAPQNNLLAVGDDDQSIYAFRGATIENILNFERDFPDAVVVPLEQNYRSTQTILDTANSVIAKNKERRSKTLWTEGEEGNKIGGYIGYDENDEASFIAREIDSYRKNGRNLSEIAVFYRTNAQTRALEEALMSYGLPYIIYGGMKFYERKEIKDILSYLRLAINESDNQAFLRCVNTPTRGIGNKAILKLKEIAIDNHCSLFSAAKLASQSSKAVAVFVSLVLEFQKLIKNTALHELLRRVVDDSGYRKKLEKINDVASLSRIENLEELIAIGAAMSNVHDTPEEDLRAFLDRVSLTSGGEIPEKEDTTSGENIEKPETISLMTLHLAKGLEYPVVFLSGMEEGLLPHYRSLDNEFELSEERRLCYVGITRAMEKLYMTRAERRGMFGSSQGMYRKESRFMNDIPPQFFSEGVRESTLGMYDTHYEYQDELTYEKVKELQEKASTGKKKKMKAAVVQSADKLHESQYVKEWKVADLASLEELTEETMVIHKTFGKGTIQEIQKAKGRDPESSKIVVKFDDFSLPKKLIFKHAKLALHNGRI